MQDKFSMDELESDILQRRLGKIKISTKVSNEIEILKPISEVFSAISTANTWLLYPESIMVAGVTTSPLARGDLVIEKVYTFGNLVNLIWFIDEFNPPYSMSMFYNRIFSSSKIVDKMSNNFMASIKYKLTSIDQHTTIFERSTQVDCLKSGILYEYLVKKIRRDLTMGSTIYLSLLKQFIEKYPLSNCSSHAKLQS